MKYIPAEVIRPSNLKEVAGPAIVFAEPGRDDVFLVTGVDPRYACFIGGTYAGDGFRQDQAARWSGLAIEGVRFELDPSSAFKPAFVQQPLGALIRTGSELQIFVGTKDSHGFNDGICVPVVDQLPPSSSDTEIGFRKWRALIGEGPNMITVFDFEANRTADAR